MVIIIRLSGNGCTIFFNKSTYEWCVLKHGVIKSGVHVCSEPPSTIHAHSLVKYCIIMSVVGRNVYL